MGGSGLEPVAVPVEIDKESSTPLYLQLAESLEAAIGSGALKPGSRIENELALSRRLDLARPTVRQGIQELVDKGLLVRKRGVGTKVVEGQVNRTMALTSLYDDLRAAGKNPTTDVLDYRISPCTDETARKLLIDPGEFVLELKRLRRMDGQPLALMFNVLPAKFAPAHADLLEMGLYEALRLSGVKTAVAHQRIGAVAATEGERALEEQPGAPLLFMERQGFLDDGRVLEYGYHLYRPSLYEFEVTLVDK